MTLLKHHAIDAVLIAAARWRWCGVAVSAWVRVGIAVTTRQRTDVGLKDLNVADRAIHLKRILHKRPD